MKKLFIILVLFSFFAVKSNAETIRVLGQLQVVWVGYGVWDVICLAPYDNICFEVNVGGPASPTSRTAENDQLNEPQVKVVGEKRTKDGEIVKVYRISKDVFEKMER